MMRVKSVRHGAADRRVRPVPCRPATRRRERRCRCRGRARGRPARTGSSRSRTSSRSCGCSASRCSCGCCSAGTNRVGGRRPARRARAPPTGSTATSPATSTRSPTSARSSTRWPTACCSSSASAASSSPAAPRSGSHRRAGPRGRGRRRHRGARPPLGARRIDVTWFGKAGTFGLMFAFPLFLAGSQRPCRCADFAGGWPGCCGIPGLVLLATTRRCSTCRSAAGPRARAAADRRHRPTATDRRGPRRRRQRRTVGTGDRSAGVGSTGPRRRRTEHGGRDEGRDHGRRRGHPAAAAHLQRPEAACCRWSTGR